MKGDGPDRPVRVRVSVSPFIARAIRVCGHAEPPVERDDLVGPGLYIGITPIVSWSWNMAGNPAGDTWYELSKALHGPSPSVSGLGE